VVAAALNEGLTPYWETVFLPCSMGFRPGRGAWGVLAKPGRVMAEEGRWVLATDVVRKPFDTVHVTDIMAEHRRHIADDALLRLIEVVIRSRACGTASWNESCGPPAGMGSGRLVLQGS
jgi:RNA-directed DNA polymerase